MLFVTFFFDFRFNKIENDNTTQAFEIKQLKLLQTYLKKLNVNLNTNSVRSKNSVNVITVIT